MQNKYCQLEPESLLPFEPKTTDTQCRSNQCSHYIWQKEAIKSKGIGLAQSRVKHLKTENLLGNTSEIIVSYVDK